MSDKLDNHDKLKVVNILYQNPQVSWDAIQMRLAVDSRNLDWHEYAEYLDFLANTGFAMVTGIGRDGHVQYRLNLNHHF